MRYKDKERLDVYLTRQEKDLLHKISEETGKSIAFLLLRGFAYWLKYSKQKIRFAKMFSAERELREIKENQRKSGDYVGSFEKFKEKKKAIMGAYEAGNFGKVGSPKAKQVRSKLLFETYTDYGRSQELFLKSKGIEVSK